jgi:pilus assembly protein Flp/PilA
MKDRLLQFALDQRGATAIEYGIIEAGIAVAIAASVNQVGCELNNSFNRTRPPSTENRVSPSLEPVPAG